MSVLCMHVHVHVHTCSGIRMSAFMQTNVLKYEHIHESDCAYMHMCTYTHYVISVSNIGSECVYYRILCSVYLLRKV